MRIRIPVVVLAATFALAACNPFSTGDAPLPDTPAPPASTSLVQSPASPVPPRATPTTAIAAPVATTLPPTNTAVPRVIGPVGFPVDPTLRPLHVSYTTQGPRLLPPAADGPTVLDVAKSIYPRPNNDAAANEFGWDCRTHAQYEDYPAVDWYLPLGTPLIATMDATATLYVIFPQNSFQYYGLDANTYLGLPNPSLPKYPFSGESGGMGVFISLSDGVLQAEYGHTDPQRTIANVPENAFQAPYSRAFNYAARFAKPLGPNAGTAVARWSVKRGDVIGFVGNSGYSDVPHLHYQIITPDRGTKYCPSGEDLPYSGWLFKRPTGFPGYP